MIIRQFILAPIGWLYLLLRCRNHDTVRRVCKEEYAGEYWTVGLILILNTIAGLGAAFLLVALIAITGAMIVRALRGG